MHRQQLADLIFTQDQRHGDNRVQALAQQEIVQDAAAALRLLAHVVQGEVIAGIQEGFRDPFQYRGEIPALDVRHNKPNVVVAPGSKAGSVIGRNEPQLPRRLLCQAAALRRDVGLAAQRPRYCGDGQAGPAGNFFDARQCQSAAVSGPSCSQRSPRMRGRGPWLPAGSGGVRGRQASPAAHGSGS